MEPGGVGFGNTVVKRKSVKIILVWHDVASESVQDNPEIESREHEM